MIEPMRAVGRVDRELLAAEAMMRSIDGDAHGASVASASFFQIKARIRHDVDYDQTTAFAAAASFESG
jgi:hypothetical protein